jgi:hypothetical protein
MHIRYSDKLVSDVRSTLERLSKESPVIDVSSIAEHIRARNETENVALEDVETLVIKVAGYSQHAIFLGRDRVLNGAVIEAASMLDSTSTD